MATKKPRPLKLWNGHARIRGRQIHVNVAAHSVADVVALLDSVGERVTAHYIRGWWSDCWGTTIKAALPNPARGIYDDTGQEIR